MQKISHLNVLFKVNVFIIQTSEHILNENLNIARFRVLLFPFFFHPFLYVLYFYFTKLLQIK